MLDKGIMIKEIRDVLGGTLKKANKVEPAKLESTKWWTKQIMRALCGWGLEKGFWVGAAGMSHPENRKRFPQKHRENIGNEWLYDLTCLKYTSNQEWLTGIPLVAECEWGNMEQIYEDFEKLLLARADVRLMIFNGNYFRNGQNSIPSNGLDVFRRYIGKCDVTHTGDTYLFAARLHDNKDGKSINHRFDCHLFVA